MTQKQNKIRIISKQPPNKIQAKEETTYPLLRWQSKYSNRITKWTTLSSKNHTDISAQIQWNNCIYMRLLKQKPDYFRDSNFFNSLINDDYPYEDVQHRQGTGTKQILTAQSNKKIDFKIYMNQLYVFYLNKDRKHDVFFYSQDNMTFSGENQMRSFINGHPDKSVIIFLYTKQSQQIQFYYHQESSWNTRVKQLKFAPVFEQKLTQIKCKHKIIMIFSLILSLDSKFLEKLFKTQNVKQQLYRQLQPRYEDIDALIDGIERRYAECQIDVEDYFGQFLRKLERR